QLYKFTIAADGKGDIGFAKATFKISTTTVAVDNLKLYEDGVDITKTAITATVAESTAAGVDIFEVLLKTEQLIGNEYVLVGAGSSKTYVLKGDVSGWGAAGDKITVEMLGDNNFGAVQKFTTVDGYADDNFIWSDLFLGFNTTTATGANEWANSYKLLSTTTQSFTY
ncbi:MAG: hypothetical protein WC389_18615, partial [Lutibacter sp.]